MYVGIDLGGTNTGAAIVDGSGKILKHKSIRTDVAGGHQTVVDGLLSVCEALLQGSKEPKQPSAQPTSIGIGVPGTVNVEKGEVIFSPNLPLRETNITNALHEKYGCPVRLGNDANCAALGEAVAGGAKGAKSAVFITLGTGLGGGIILGGRLLTGLSGAAGELGHMVIIEGGRECGCGRRGCWEAYASATGLKKTAIELMGANAGSALWELSGGATGKIDGSMVFKASAVGDKIARQAVEIYTWHLATGIANIINMLEPEMICIGGGISNSWEIISRQLIKLVGTEIYARFSADAPKTQIVKAQLGNDAGIIGAAALGFE